MIARIFYFISALVFLLGVFILLTPSLLNPEVIYPERIDSTYIAFHTERFAEGYDTILISPADVGLKYSDIQITTEDGYKLNGWYVNVEDTPANTILLIHDLNESKILYLDHLRQFHDRGFNVCIFDLRAHGTSGGNEFTPGIPAVKDVKLMTDSVMARKETKHMIYFGVGVGAAIVLQSAIHDDRCKGVVLQSPFNSYENYVERFAKNKWGMMYNFWYPVLKRRIEALLQYPLKELDLRDIATFVTCPTMFVIGSDDERVFTSEALQVYDASGTEKKELFLVRNAGHENIAKAGKEGYYNRIASFLITSMPKEQKITRYKKLAME